MKKIIFLLLAIFSITTFVSAQSKAGRVDTAKNVVLYTCPMHPNVTSHEPGKCSVCGMEMALSGKEKMKASATKNYTCPIHKDVASHDPGKCPKCGRAMNLSPKEQMKAEVVKLYTCPMHPDVALTKDGICPKCGKDLVEKKTKQKS